MAAAGQFEVDGLRRPLVFSPLGLDQRDEVGVELGRGRVRDRGPNQQADLTELVEPSFPLRQTLP